MKFRLVQPLVGFLPANVENSVTQGFPPESKAIQESTSETMDVVERVTSVSFDQLEKHEEPARPKWVRVSPAARRAARELDVELKTVKGTGPHGRVTRADVEMQAVDSQQSSSRHASAAAPEEVLAIEETESNTERVPLASVSSRDNPFKKYPLSAMRKTIADRMIASWTQIPQVPLLVDVNLFEAEKFRAAMQKLDGKNVSLTAIVTKALASAIRSFPDLNARFDGNEIREYVDVDVSIAVALDNGLVTPLIRGANKKTASEILRRGCNDGFESKAWEPSALGIEGRDDDCV